MWDSNFFTFNYKMPWCLIGKKYINSLNKVWLQWHFYFIDYAKTFDCVDHIKVWKILKEMDHLTFFLRNMYVSQEAQLELDMERQTGSK